MSGVDRGLVITSQGHVHYYAAGGGVPLVLVHKSARSGRMYLDLMRRLRADARSYAVDLPNFGCSDAAPGPLTIERTTAALAEVIEATIGRPAVVAGLAMGAYMATDVAYRRPDLVRGLIMVSTPCYDDLADATARHVAARTNYPTDEFGFPLLRTLESFTEHDRERSPRELHRHWIEAVNQDLMAAGRHFWDGMPIIASYDLTSALEAIDQPVLMNWGDEFMYTARHRQVADHVRNGRVELIRGSGLYPELDNPDELVTSWRTFLAELSAA